MRHGKEQRNEVALEQASLEMLLYRAPKVGTNAPEPSAALTPRR